MHASKVRNFFFPKKKYNKYKLYFFNYIINIKKIFLITIYILLNLTIYSKIVYGKVKDFFAGKKCNNARRAKNATMHAPQKMAKFATLIITNIIWEIKLFL